MDTENQKTIKAGEDNDGRVLGKVWPVFQNTQVLLLITENEIFAGGHKLDTAHCVNAQREAPHLADLECCHPTASQYSPVPSLNIQSHDVTLNPPRNPS